MYVIGNTRFRETFARLCPGKDLKAWLKCHIRSYRKEDNTFYDYSECCRMGFDEWFDIFFK